MTPWSSAGWAFDADGGACASLDDGATMSLRFLSASMARVTLRPARGFREPRSWSVAPEGEVPWEGRDRADLGGLGPAPAIHADAAASTLTSERLQVRLDVQPLRLAWSTAAGQPVCSDRCTSAYLREHRTGGLRHYVQRDPGDRYYGLGDKTGRLNLHGRRLRTMSMDALGYDPEHGDPLYKHWPFLLVRAAAGAWYGVYYDTLAACSFDLGQEHDNYHGFYRHVEIDDGDLDYYLMVGATPAEVIAQFVRLVGGTALPPRWSLGFGQTAMGLADAPDAQAQLEGFIQRMREHRVPVSSFHYGSGYTSRGARRYVFTWNRSKFPAPQALNASFRAQGLRLVANLKPVLLDDHPAWNEVKGFDGFVHHRPDVHGDPVPAQADGAAAPVLEPFWDGMGAHLDFTHRATIAWWQRRFTEQVLDVGIDVGWNDNNEFAVLDETAACAGFGRPMPIHRCRPLHALLMTRATFEAQRSHAPQEPVYTVTRAGPPGIQRYAQTWSGDNTTSWRSLRWNIRTGLQMSLSGMFNVGHDVGGFYGPLPDAELFLRWVQACCLNPRMVMNSWKPGGASNLPWMHPDVTADVVRAIELRYHLMPHLWSLFQRAHTLHEPIIRPTFYDFPEVEACFDDSDDFMLGADLLVAPVVEAGARTRAVFLPPLPEGKPWFSFDGGEAFDSGRRHVVDAPLSRLPVFARHGACIAVADLPVDGSLAHHDLPMARFRRFGEP